MQRHALRQMQWEQQQKNNKERSSVIQKKRKEKKHNRLLTTVPPQKKTKNKTTTPPKRTKNQTQPFQVVNSVVRCISEVSVIAATELPEETLTSFKWAQQIPFSLGYDKQSSLQIQ